MNGLQSWIILAVIALDLIVNIRLNRQLKSLGRELDATAAEVKEARATLAGMDDDKEPDWCDRCSNIGIMSPTNPLQSACDQCITAEGCIPSNFSD